MKTCPSVSTPNAVLFIASWEFPMTCQFKRKEIKTVAGGFARHTGNK